MHGLGQETTSASFSNICSFFFYNTHFQENEEISLQYYFLFINTLMFSVEEIMT